MTDRSADASHDVVATPSDAGGPTTDPTERDARALKTPRSIAIARWALPALLVVTVAVFSLIQPETYFTSANLKAVAVTQAVLAILAIAALLPLVIGAFDVSVAANLGLGAILATGLAAKQGLPAEIAIVGAIVACTAVGLVNGLLVAKAGINAFIATLGMSTILSGAVLWYTGGTTIFEGVPELVTDIGRSSIVGIPLPVVILAVVALLAWHVLEHTPFGRYLHALGGSYDAARLSGLNVGRLTIVTFVLSGFLAGIAGVVEAGELGAGNPTVGPSFLLPAFAAAFLGATAIKVGSFNVWGTIIAVYVLAAGVTGLEQNGVPQYIEPIFTGVALILGVGLVRLLRREADPR